MPTMSVLTITGLAALLTVGSAAVASAGGAEPAASTDAWGPRASQACSRVPARLARAEKLHARLGAGQQTRGSIAFLAARIARAEAVGDTEEARLLSERMAVRQEIGASLPAIISHLENAQAICTEQGSS